MIKRVYGSVLYGVEAFLTTVEVSISKGLGYQITGLADEVIRESLSRIGIAIQQEGFRMPRNKLLIHLAPASLPKSGTSLDLPIAIGILLASGQIEDLGKLQQYVLFGELSLDGRIRGVRGAVCASEMAARKKFSGILAPTINAAEAALVKNIAVYSVSQLKEVIDFVHADFTLSPAAAPSIGVKLNEIHSPDFSEVHGQERLKRAMEIAAAGGHNTLMVGPPGVGKSMVAKCLPSILPPLTEEEMLETTRIQSVIRRAQLMQQLCRVRPFRSIHHSISDAGLVGGGLNATPGEITLAHRGVLFIDELAECKVTTLEALRQPMEDGKIIVSRAKHKIEYPAAFILIAAMNPCPCGYRDHGTRLCTCSKRALFWYRRKISGPLLDRIDIQVEAEPVDATELFISAGMSESSAVIRKRVMAAHQRQTNRFDKSPQTSNAQMSHEQVMKYCMLDEFSKRFLLRQIESLQLSVRSIDKILKIARTIADLSGDDHVELAQVAEAISLRALDKPVVDSSNATRKKHEH